MDVGAVKSPAPRGRLRHRWLFPGLGSVSRFTIPLGSGCLRGSEPQAFGEAERWNTGPSVPISFLTSTYRAVIFLFLLIFSNPNSTFQWLALLGSADPYFPKQTTDGFVFYKQGLACFLFWCAFSNAAEGCFKTSGFCFPSTAR